MAVSAAGEVCVSSMVLIRWHAYEAQCAWIKRQPGWTRQCSDQGRNLKAVFAVPECVARDCVVEDAFPGYCLEIVRDRVENNRRRVGGGWRR